MTVGAILESKGREVTTGSPDQSLREISQLLAKHKIGAVVIVEPDGSVCGIASERDIVRQVASQGAQALDAAISSCMTREVISAREADTVDAVMGLMSQKRFRHLPVTENGKLVGLISIGDVVKRKIEQAERDAEELKRYIAG